jgi:hypothetical protein
MWGFFQKIVEHLVETLVRQKIEEFEKRVTDLEREVAVLKKATDLQRAAAVLHTLLPAKGGLRFVGRIGSGP